MKLSELLNQIKIGEDEYKTRENVDAVLETFDEDDDQYKTSKLIDILSAKLTESKNENNVITINRIKKTAIKIGMYEDKFSTGKEISKSYHRMKFDSIKENYNEIIHDLESKKVQRSMDKEILSHAVALIKHKIIQLAEAAEIQNPKLRELPETLRPFVDKEYKLIIENIG